PLHFLMLVEESVLGFSLRCLQPGVFEFQLGRVLGQQIRKRAHARSLATVRHLSGPCCSTIHSSDRNTAMRVPFTKTRKCTSISKSGCEAGLGLPDAAGPSAKTTSPSRRVVELIRGRGCWAACGVGSALHEPVRLRRRDLIFRISAHHDATLTR